jgi:hypothetical protein
MVHDTHINGQHIQTDLEGRLRDETARHTREHTEHLAECSHKIALLQAQLNDTA